LLRGFFIGSTGKEIPGLTRRSGIAGKRNPLFCLVLGPVINGNTTPAALSDSFVIRHAQPGNEGMGEGTAHNSSDGCDQSRTDWLVLSTNRFLITSHATTSPETYRSFVLRFAVKKHGETKAQSGARVNAAQENDGVGADQ
jgi:hypothetical protein